MLRVLVLVAVALGPLSALADNRPVLLVLGDSLSAAHGIDADRGWVARLERRLERQGYAWRVVNASIGGDTTRGALSRLPDALERHEPAVVVVELGGNDGLQGQPLEAMRANLARIIERCREHGARVLLVGVRLPPNYGPRYTERFHTIYGELAERYEVPRVPRLLDGVAGDDALMQDDGVHPAAEAQPRLLDNVWARLEPMLEEKSKIENRQSTIVE